MSQSHIKKTPEAPSPIIGWKVAVGAAIVVLLLASVFVATNWSRSISPTYSTTSGKVLEIRKAVDGNRDSRFGDQIFYGVEARVQYSTNGQMHERWLRASDNMPRETLFLKLVSHPTECLVYWPPSQPENAKCWLK
jgi:hypothetical protein